jgi:hypothetical protein
MCVRYEVPLRQADFNSNPMEENASTIYDPTRCPSIILRSLEDCCDRLILSVAEYTNAANETSAILYREPAKTYNLTIMLNSICCIDPRQGTIIKWAVCTTTAKIHHHNVFILPPLLLRSIIAAEERYAFFQVAQLRVPSLKIPKPAVRLVGEFMIPLLKKAVRTYIDSKPRNYYPTMESPSRFKANLIYGHSEFDQQTRTDKLITFADTKL